MKTGNQDGKAEKGEVYTSPYENAYQYTSDKNFIVRLKALVDRKLNEAGYKLGSSEQFYKFLNSLDSAEDYLFSSTKPTSPADSREENSLIASRIPYPDHSPAPVTEGVEEAAQKAILELKHVITTVSEARKLFIMGATWQSSQPKASGEELTIYDYKEVIEDHKRLVRELDVIINGDNAAKQASLCDIVAQLGGIKAKTNYELNSISDIVRNNEYDKGFHHGYVVATVASRPTEGCRWVKITRDSVPKDFNGDVRTKRLDDTWIYHKRNYDECMLLLSHELDLQPEFCLPQSSLPQPGQEDDTQLWDEVKETLKLSVGLDPYRSNKIVDYLQSLFHLTKHQNK